MDSSYEGSSLEKVVDVLTPHNSEWIHALHPSFDLAATLESCPTIEDFQARLVDICNGIDRKDLAKIAAEATEGALHDYMVDLNRTLEGT
jgi:hypothetical protein